MTEACATCDTLWRLYGVALDHLRELASKHGEARGSGERQTVEILGHEIAIAEASLRAVRRELTHHTRRHTATPSSSPNSTASRPA